MIVLDASVVIAHLDPENAHHEAATGILLAAAPRELVVHSLTMAEVLVGGVQVGRGAELQADLAAAGAEVAECDDQEPMRLAELCVSTGLRLPDCCVLDLALVSGAALATFDQALARAAAARGVRVLN